jgi:hypothetical protein
MPLTRHSLVFGAEYEDVSARRSLDHTGGFLFYRYADGTIQSISETAAGTLHNHVATTYLSDAWKIARDFNLTLGLRWSSQTLLGASGRTAQKFSNEWQPRVGMIWAPETSGKERAFVTYGRFYQQLPLNLSTIWYLDFNSWIYSYDVDPRLPGATPSDSTDASSPESYWAKNIAGLEVENSDEITFGYERVVGSSRISARLIHRWLRSSFQWGYNPELESIWVLGTPGKGDFDFLPPPRRDYRALEISSVGTWKRANYRLSYVLSRNRGNYTGLYSSDISAGNPGASLTLMAPYQRINSTGLMPNDHTHVFKASASRALSFGFTTGISLAWESGSPINEFASPPPGFGGLAYAFAAPRGSAGRTPALWDLDLRITKDFKRWGARGMLDVLNVGNPQKPVVLNEIRYKSNSGFDFSDENTHYKEPLSYQPPMMARLGFAFGW